MATIIEGGGGGSGTGVIAGILLVALVVVVLFLYFGGTFNGGSKTVDIDVPAVTVQTTPDGQ